MFQLGLICRVFIRVFPLIKISSKMCLLKGGLSLIFLYGHLSVAF